MNKIVLYAMFVGIGTSLCGCGFIPIAYTRTVPKPIMSIQAVDSQTTTMIPNAEVRCFYEQYTYKMMHILPSVRNEFAESHGILLDTIKEPDGTFRIETQTVTVYSGFFITNDCIITISVKADTYIPFSIRYFPEEKPHGEQMWETGNRTKLTKDGQLIIFLDKVTITPIRTIIVMDALTQQPLLHATVNCFYEEFPAQTFPSEEFFWRESEPRFKPIHAYAHELPLVKHPQEGIFSIQYHDGDILFDHHVLVTINAKAENYQSFSLTSHAQAFSVGEKKWPYGSRTVFTEDGQLRIYLQKE